MSFTHYFTDREIIRQLCQERVKLAGQRHEETFLHNISRNQTTRPVKTPTLWGKHVSIDMFPPRRVWHRFRPPRAARHGSSDDINVSALVKAVMTLRKNTPRAPWVLKLNQVIMRIRRRALTAGPFRFQKPTILAEEKEPGSNVYRPLAVFPLEDKVIDRQTASYLRRALDSFLHPSCLAFRCSYRGKAPPTIHDALDHLEHFRATSHDPARYAAECDLRGFFDCVPHSLAQESIDALITQHDDQRTEPLDPRARRILAAYLAAYSFQRNVKNDAEPHLQTHHPQAKFKWPEPELRAIHPSQGLWGIGVPQGGALSCLIANAVLHIVDDEMEQLMHDHPRKLLYLRYCDDMILLATDRALGIKALDTYCTSVTALGLLIHPCKHVLKYTKAFYTGKSHYCYQWGPGKSAIPWIQFVGYQLRHDGLVRIRPRSLKKQRRRMTDITDAVLKALNPGRQKPGAITPLCPGVRRTAKQIAHRLHQRLIAIAVGRRQLGHNLATIMPMCWCHGFRGLRHRRIVSSSLKMLDRHREHQVSRVVRRLKRQQLPHAPPVNKDRALKFYGLPFSYWGQFH